MDRMIENTREFFATELTWWTQQLTQQTEQAMAQGERALKTSGELVQAALKTQTTQLEAMGERAQAVVTRQTAFWQGLFQTPAA